MSINGSRLRARRRKRRLSHCEIVMIRRFFTCKTMSGQDETVDSSSLKQLELFSSSVKDINRLKMAANSHKYAHLSLGLRLLESYHLILCHPIPTIEVTNPTNPSDSTIHPPPRLYLTIALSPSSSATTHMVVPFFLPLSATVIPTFLPGQQSNNPFTQAA